MNAAEGFSVHAAPEADARLDLADRVASRLVGWLHRGVELSAAATLTLEAFSAELNAAPVSWWHRRERARRAGLRRLLEALGSGQHDATLEVEGLPIALRQLTRATEVDLAARLRGLQMAEQARRWLAAGRELYTLLPAQMKISTAIIAGMPIAMYAILGIINPRFLSDAGEMWWMGLAGVLIALTLLAGLQQYVMSWEGLRLRRLADETDVAGVILAELAAGRPFSEALMKAGILFDAGHPIRSRLSAIASGRPAGADPLSETAVLAATGMRGDDLASWLHARILSEASETASRLMIQSHLDLTVSMALLVAIFGVLLAGLMTGWVHFFGLVGAGLP